MGLQLPGELVFAMSLVGFDWPLADEEKLAESADLWRSFAMDFRERAADADVGAREVVGLNEGATIDAFAGYWAGYAGAGGRLEAAAGEADHIAVVLDAASGIVLALKLAVIAQLVYLAAQIAIGIAAAAPTGGASLAAAGIAAATTKVTVKILLDQAKRALLDLAERSLKDAADRITRMVADAKPPRNPDATPNAPGTSTPSAAGTPRGPDDPDGPGGRRDPDSPTSAEGIPPPTSQTREGYREVLDNGATPEKYKDSEILGRQGDAESAQRDFDALRASQEPTTYPNGTRKIELEDGTRVTLRSSSDGRATIELFDPETKTSVKYRYGEKP